MAGIGLKARAITKLEHFSRVESFIPEVSSEIGTHFFKKIVVVEQINLR